MPRRFRLHPARATHRFASVLLCLLLLIVGTASVPTAQATPGATLLRQAENPAIDPQLAKALNHVLDQTIANKNIPGVALSVRIPGYQTWQGARGVAQRKAKLAMDPAYNTRIASITKMFVATVVLQLVEEEQLALDLPISTWLPNIAPAAATVTVRQLLNHTTGLYDYLDGPFLRGVQRAPQRIWAPHELLAYAVAHKPYFAPGAPKRWAYSNTNYVVLGMLVEQVTQRSLAREIRSRVLNPVGLTQTFFAPDEAVLGTLVHGYAGAKDLTHLNMSYAWASGNMASTVDDLGLFVRALFGGQLLRPATLDSMYQWVDTRGAWGLPHMKYGLGVMRNRLAVGRDPLGQPRPAEASSVLGHIGNLGGYRSAVWYLPASGITIAVGINQGGANPILVTTRVLDAILSFEEQQAMR